MLMKIAFALLLLASIVYAVASLDRENPAVQRQAQQELDNFRGFAFSVMRFSRVNYQYEGELMWSDESGGPSLRDAPSTPSSLRAIHMPASWKAVFGNGDYVLCASLSEAAVALMGKEMPAVVGANVLPVSAAASTTSFGDAAVVFATAEDLTPTSDEQPAEAEQWTASCTQ